MAGPTPIAPSRAALAVSHVSKAFGGTLALDDASISVGHGEVLALLGHNGSGKSTLIKILAGFHDPDGPAEGTVDGEPFVVGSAEEAARVGLRFVHQDLGIVSELDAVDNIALATGYVRTGAGQIDRGAMVRRTDALLGRFGIDIDPSALLARATPVQRSGVAIARALWDWESAERRILVLDEPTAALPPREVDRLFELVEAVRAAGHGVIYVTHRMNEVFRLADRVVVLRSGRVIETAAVDDVTPAVLAELIAGEELASERVRETRLEPTDARPPVLRVSGLSGRYVDDVELAVAPGEILGIAGLQGSGREELPYLLAGATPSAGAARWERDGAPAPAPSMAAAVDHGIAFVPAERGAEGLIADFTVGENLSLVTLASLRRGGAIFRRDERRLSERWLRELGVPVGVIDQPIGTLSGGNQQRVLLAKWFCTEPSLLIVSEPTAGVDVGARRAVYELLAERAARGLAIVVASSDIEDLVELSDRVLVMREGVVATELTAATVGTRDILASLEKTLMSDDGGA